MHGQENQVGIENFKESLCWKTLKIRENFGVVGAIFMKSYFVLDVDQFFQVPNYLDDVGDFLKLIDENAAK